jgi:hypothetical protein
MNRLLIVVTLLLGGCAVTHTADNARSSAAFTHPEQYIVVAVANSGNAMTRSGSTAHGYDAGSVQAVVTRNRREHDCYSMTSRVTTGCNP